MLTSFLTATFRLIERVEIVVCAFLLAILTGLVVVNVGLRYLFSAPLYYAEELSVVLMIWASFLAASVALGRREMIAVTLVPDMLPRKLGDVVMFVVHVLVLATSMTFFYWSFKWITGPSAARDVIVTLSVSKWWSYLIVPIFFLLATIKSVANVFHYARAALK